MNSIDLYTFVIGKRNINERTFQPIFEIDGDFSENEEYFRKKTLKKGFDNEAHRCSTEVFNTFNTDEFSSLSDLEKFTKMFEACFTYKNFIGDTGYYSAYETKINETVYEYVVSIAVMVDC